MTKPIFNIPTPTIPIFTRLANKWLPSPESFPVRRIYCVGRNYREHTLEMGGNPDKEAPFFFLKPNDSIVDCTVYNNATYTTNVKSVVPYPTQTKSLHHEAEVIIAIGRDGLRIPTSQAADYIYGYSLGCDLTRRDLQSEAKRRKRPWDSAKGFDSSCPLSGVVPKDMVDLNEESELILKVNGAMRQQAVLGSMIYSIPEVISELSKLFWLKRGDLIMTGTPAGVGDLNVGDCVEIQCGDLLPCSFVIGPAE